MKKISLLVGLFLMAWAAQAQISGTKNIPGDYASLAAAITDLNTQGVGTGGVIINLNQIETAPSGGYILGSATLNGSVSASKTITINGNLNTITAQSNTASTNTTSDAVLRIAGTDYVTLNQIKIVENAANTTANTQMERGIACMAFSATDGCQNITIQNCDINLNGAAQNTNEGGIVCTNVLFNNTTSNNTTSVLPTAQTGAFDFIVIKSNTINNCYTGIVAHGGTSSTLPQTSFIVGGTATSDANTITNYGSLTSGTTTTGFAINLTSVSNCYVSNNNVSVTNLFSGGTHIQLNSCGGVSVASKNNVSFSTNSANTNAQTAINYTMFTANGSISSRCDSNIVSNITLGGNASFIAINFSVSTFGPNLWCRNNLITNINRTAIGGNISGIVFGGTSVSTTNRQLTNNVISKITATALTANITFNGFQWSGGSGLMKSNVIDSITISNTSTALSVINLINNASTTAGVTVAHIVDSNTVKNILLNGPAFTVYGATINNGISVNNFFTRNVIGNIFLTGGATTTTTLEGIFIGTNTGSALYVTDNIISGISGSALNNDNAIKGISIVSGDATKNQILHNTIYLGNAATLTSSGTNFGVSGIVFTVGATIKNNIVNVNATPAGTGRVSAIRALSAGTTGVVSTNFGSNSSNNILFAPNVANSFLYAEAAANAVPVVFYNLTNDPLFNSSCSIFKTAAGTRGGGTYVENNLVNLGDLVFAPTGASNAEATAILMPTDTLDYYGVNRTINPDCGAVQFNGLQSDLSGPTIVYTALSNSTYCNNLPSLSATITDPSGVNNTTFKPRMYYKKSSDADAFAGNTSANNGWKFVEASNTTSPFTFSFDINLLTAPPTLGDIIQYFVVAQDNVTPTANVGSNAVTYATGFCPSNVALTNSAFPIDPVTIPNSFTIIAPNVTLGTSATPAIVCIGASSTLVASDTTLRQGAFPTGYTGPYVTGATDDDIRRVQIVGTTLNNSSTCTSTGSGAVNGLPASIVGRYANYTATITPVTLTSGSTYTVNMDISLCNANSGITTGISAFIDLNRNGVFDMPTERVYGSPSQFANTTTVSTRTFTFTIPSTGVVNGPTLMRFYIAEFTNGTTHTPSSTTNFGEVEDYMVFLNTNVSPFINELPSTNFTWTPSANITTNPNKTVVANNNTANTTYTVTATDAGGCSYTKTINVDIAAPVIASTVTGTTSYCASTPNTTLTATASSGVPPYAASWSGGPLVSQTGMSAVLNPPVGTTTYTVVVSDFCGSTSSTTVDVTVLPLPTATITPGNANGCFGAFVNQSATGSTPTTTFTWNPGSIAGPSASLFVNSTQTYTVTATDGLCSSTTTFQIVVRPLPSFTSNTATPSTAVCAGDSIQLNAVAVSGISEYVLNTTAYNPLTPSGSPTVLCSGGSAVTAQTISSLNNGTWTALPIGFTFEFYGTNQTTFNVSTNGFISFGSLTTAGSTAGQNIPSTATPNNLIALAWGDLDFTSGGTLDYFVNGTAPNRKLVVRYTNVPRVGGASGLTTGQIILHETTGTIELQIGSVTTAAGDLTTMGIENQAGLSALVINNRNASAPWTATNEGWIIEKSPISGYVWSPNTNINNINIQNPKVAPNFTTQYTVTASNAYGCTKSTIVTANIRALMTGIISPTVDTICIGENSTINATVPVVCVGNVSNFQGYYAPSNWTSSNDNSNGFVSTGSVPASISIISGTNGSGNPGYTYYTKTVGCAGNVSFNWNYSTADFAFLDMPFYSINGGTPVLLPGFNAASATVPNSQSGSVSIPVNAGDNISIIMYTDDNDPVAGALIVSNFSAPAAPITGSVAFWSAPTGGTNLGANTITVNPTSTTKYYVEYTEGGFNCVNPYRDSVQVVVNPLPVLTTTALPNDTVCAGTPITLSAANAVTYTWNGNPTVGSDTLFTQAIAGTYTVVGVDANGCSNSATQSVVVNALPAVTATVNTPICLGASAIFTGGGAGSGATYVWDSPIIDGLHYTPGTSGSYTYQVTGTDANGCSNTSSATLVVNALPTVQANANPTIICPGSPTILTGSGTATGYTWTDGSQTPQNNIPFIQTANGTTTYTVTGTDANTCSATSTVSVMMYTPTNFTGATILTAKCPGQIGGSVVVSAPVTNLTIAPAGPQQPSSGVFTSLMGGTVYTVTLTDANSCTNTTSVSATNPSNGELANATSANATSTPGNSCQAQNQTDGTSMTYYGATCDDVIATIVDASGGNVLGNVNTCVTVMPTVPVYQGQPYLPRYYVITPTNQGPANITLYFTQDDFDDYNAAAGSFPTIPANPATGSVTFCISQVPQGFLPGASGASTTVHTVTATWNATLQRWEVTFPVSGFSGFYCHACNPNNSALPASVINFNGRKTENSSVLSWTSVSEMNNATFELMYSEDGKAYQTIGVVNSKAENGISNKPIDYVFEHQTPQLGHNYYKLSQTDIDGKQSYYPSIVDLIWSTNGTATNIYPNPANDELHIDLYTTKPQHAQIKLIDMSGRVVKELTSNLQQGANHIQLQIADIASGLYSVQIFENNTLTQVSKVKKN